MKHLLLAILISTASAASADLQRTGTTTLTLNGSSVEFQTLADPEKNYAQDDQLFNATVLTNGYLTILLKEIYSCETGYILTAETMGALQDGQRIHTNDQMFDDVAKQVLQEQKSLEADYPDAVPEIILDACSVRGQ